MATNHVSPDAEPASNPVDPVTLPEKSPAVDAEAKARKKREKIRSAWISFVGRIVAQLVGAAATIALGLMVVQRYGVGGLESGSEGPSVAAQPAGAVDRVQRRAHNRPSVVVLPFANFSTNGGLDPVIDGLTESIVAELTRAGSLSVISRTSSMHYKGSRKPLPEIARELDVDLVIEGSVAFAEGRARVIAQLIDAVSDEHLWAQSYEQEMGDVLRLQDTIAQRIAEDVHRAAEPHLRSKDRGSVERTVARPLPTRENPQPMLRHRFVAVSSRSSSAQAPYGGVKPIVAHGPFSPRPGAGFRRHQ